MTHLRITLNRRPMETGSVIHPMSREDETFWRLRAERKKKEKGKADGY